MAAWCFAKAAVVMVSVSLPCLGHPEYCWCPGGWHLGADSEYLGGQCSSDHPAEPMSPRQLPHKCVDTALLSSTQSLFLLHILSQEETLQQLYFSLPPEDTKMTPNCFQASVLVIL